MDKNSINLKQISDIKKNIPIKKVVEKLGGLGLNQCGESLQGECPTGHESTGKKCFSVNTERNFFYCFNCGIGGDVINLVELVKDISRQEAMQWLKDNFDVDFLDVTTPIDTPIITEEEKRKEKELYEKASLYEIVYQYGKQLLFKREGQEALTYLIDERGYMADKIRQTEWIYFPPVYEIKKHLKEVQPDAGEAIDKLTLMGYFGDNFRLAFPYRNRYGLITGFLKRALKPEGVDVTTFDGKKHNNIRWDSTKGVSKKDLFNLHNCEGETTLLILEGYPDALYFPAIGLRNVVAIGQGLLSKSHIEGLIEFGIKNVIISFDNDGIGTENTEKAIDLLFKETDINVFVIDPPGLGVYKDPDEYVKANGIDAFYALIDDAQSGAKWVAKQIIGKFDLSKDLQRQQAFEAALDYDLMLKDQFITHEFRSGVSDALSIPIDVIEIKATSYKEKKERQRIESEYTDLFNKSLQMVKLGKLEPVITLLEDKSLCLKNQFYQLKITNKLLLADQLREKYNVESQRTAGMLGYPLNKFSKLAKNVDGIQPGLYIIGAETNAGKTAMLTNLCLDLIQTNKDVRALYFSLDDNKNVIINRLLGILTELDLNQVQRKQGNISDQNKLKGAYDELITLAEKERLFIKDLSEVTHYKHAEAVINELYTDNFAVFLDGLFNLEVDRETGSIREINIERANILKALCDTYRIPLICTAELRKKTKDESTNKKPSVHDLMETGKFGYNANIVWLLAPMNEANAKTSDEYAVQLNYAKNKLSYYKDYQDLWFKKMKGIICEPKLNIVGPAQGTMTW